MKKFILTMLIVLGGALFLSGAFVAGCGNNPVGIGISIAGTIMAFFGAEKLF